MAAPNMNAVGLAVFAAHLASTFVMVGVIWSVQLALYPAFLKVQEASFSDYHQFHMARISLVVIPAMLLELGSVVALPFVDLGLSKTVVYGSVASVAVVWLSTFFIQVPLHQSLSEQPTALAKRKLVNSNWIRTAGWTAHGILMGVALFEVL